MAKPSRVIIITLAGVLLLATAACAFVTDVATLAGQATATQPPSQTQKPIPTATKTRKPTSTPRPTIPTPDFDLTATTIAGTKLEVLKDLHDKHLISATDGDYYALDNFDEKWAQLFWYMWWQSGYSPTNFVIRADAKWDSASNIANWPDSGCGFVYHEEDENNHHRTYLAMDGHVYSDRYLKGVFTSLKGGYYGKLKTPSDSAQIMLIVENQTVTFLVNEKKVVSFQDTKLEGGNLAFTLVSGTNKDYGIHCLFKNIELWELPDGDN